MRKHLIALTALIALSFSANAQGGRGIRVGYIDMEYILQNVPDYIEAKNQLELKAQKWKQDAELKKNDITKLKESLKTERALLTKELIEEREEEIAFQETELSDFQQKKFGPTGELTVQKAVLVKPIQDQIFTTVQDLAELKKYDFVFDKSSDLTMLFAAKRYDMSDQVIRSLTRASRSKQMSKKELKEEEVREYQENLQDENPALAERQKKIEDRKAAREKLIADRKAAVEDKKNQAAAKRQQQIDEKNAKKNGTTVPVKEGNASTEKTSGSEVKDNTVKTDAAPAKDSVAADRAVARKAAADAKAKTMEDRKQALADKKAKAIADREAAKKAKEEKAKQDKENKDTENK